MGGENTQRDSLVDYVTGSYVDRRKLLGAEGVRNEGALGRSELHQHLGSIQ